MPGRALHHCFSRGSDRWYQTLGGDFGVDGTNDSHGDLTFARTIPSSDVKVGDILTVERPNNQGQVTHRVVAIQEVKGGHSFTLKGDANQVNDFDNYLFAEVGEVIGWIPYVGYLALALKSKIGLAVAIAVLVGLLILTIMDPQKLRSDKRSDGKPADTHSEELNPVQAA
ncbi:signal peptidase I [Leucobacter coleopterorum]|uniref:Signal peptidase I n=1 Tax=Leucobacter coleopterorum TaxID=2714933 RepID=A0ABX6K1Y3_9MICO|nr:signal peptidase I [Leucobacter coleopterorum]QIM19204.1 signal peptidase I [Leucobacter coleopterorum]